MLANFAGYYALAGVPLRGELRVQASSEASVAVKALPALRASSAAPLKADIMLLNHRPRVTGFVAMQNNALTTNVAPGSTVKLLAQAVDENADKLTYEWRTMAGSLTADNDVAEWTLPRKEGVYSAEVHVSDGKGGDDVSHITLTVGKVLTVFSGQVLDPAKKPVKGAVVSVGDKQTETSDTGAFKLTVDPAKQYVLNIRKPGFMLISRLFDRGSIQTWQLVAAQVQAVDLSKEIKIEDTRPELKKSETKGAIIAIPTGALVSAQGNAASGHGSMEIATVNLANDEMPGDLLGVINNSETGIVSYGAVWVEVTDSAGKKLQLAPGKTATVILPVPRGMLAHAPATIQVWSYDEKDGRWKTSGSATLDKVAGAYKGSVNHFSTINMDQPGPTACIAVHTDISLPSELKLRVRDVPGQGVDFAQVKTMTLAGETTRNTGGLNAVFRVPENSDVKFEILDSAGNLLPNVVVEDGNTYTIAGGTVLPGNIVNAGAASPVNWPPFPYTGCKPVTLKLQAQDLWASYPSSAFLDLRSPLPADAPSAAAADADAQAYYASIDPSSNRTTLTDWYSQNGFDANGNAPAAAPGEYARSSYLNYNDLGSGRDMNFRVLPDGLAAYVTNYDQGVLFDQRAAFADDATTRSNPGATVCMEFRPVSPGGPPIVKFFVFADGNADGVAERQVKADLDGFGARYVPGLCLNCHGGDPSTTGADRRAAFRELDVATYRFSGGRVSLPPGDPLHAAFKAQNQMIATLFASSVANQGVANQAIVDLINNWYQGGVTVQNNAYTPAGWATPANPADAAQLYNDVIKVSCRTCHIAFTPPPGSSGIDWNTLQSFSDDSTSIQDYVLSNGKYMPHALVTYRNFWLQRTGAYRPDALRTYLLNHP